MLSGRRLENRVSVRNGRAVPHHSFHYQRWWTTHKKVYWRIVLDGYCVRVVHFVLIGMFRCERVQHLIPSRIDAPNR